MVIFCGKRLLFHERWNSSDWEGAAILGFEFVRVVHEGKEEDVTLQKAMRKLSGGWNHQRALGDDQQFLLLTQDYFLTQRVLEPTSGGNVLNLMLSS